MRRKDRETDSEFALGVADKCEYAVISMIDTSGMPYCIPITVVRDGEYIYFHSAKEGEKVDAMRNNSDVCIVCVGDTKRETDKFTTKYESAIIKGIAKEVISDEEKIHALRLLCERHTPSNMGDFENAIKRSLAVTAVWKIKIVSISGKCKK